MKLDYKLPLKKTGWFPNRFMMRFALSCVALLCLWLALPSKKPNSPISENSAKAETTTLAMSKAEPDVSLSLPIPEPKPADQLTAALPATPAAAEPNKASLSSTSTESSENWRIVIVKKGDTLAKIFKRYGYSKKDLQDILNANPKHQKQLASLKTNQTLKLLLGSKRQVQGLSFDLKPGHPLQLSKKATEPPIQDKQPLALAEKQQPSVEKQLAFGKGTIRGSLFSAGKRAGLDHNVIAQMVDIFGLNIDFSLDLRPNDSFRVLFEEKRLEGERIGTGHILAAELVNGGKKYQAIRYTDKSGRTGYFSPDGRGLHQAFLRYPLNFTRISSTFGQRRHPIAHRMRQHKGIDYAAPAGTPVQATGDAKVLFVGTRGGYGRMVELQHGARHSTLYAHLSRFAKNLKIGSDIKQGQIIGYVGRTGLATGDHLHYEFRVDGIHRDPLTSELPRKGTIQGVNKPHFLAHAKEMLRLMDLHENKINVVRNDYPKNE